MTLAMLFIVLAFIGAHLIDCVMVTQHKAYKKGKA